MKGRCARGGALERHRLFLPQFPLLHRGLTPAHLSSLQVVVRVKQDSRHVVGC